jgi:hypothetical protein
VPCIWEQNMRVIELESPCPPELTASLDRFERNFRYPLGTNRWFRISHGEDYSRFYRSMGEGLSLVAIGKNREAPPLGVLGCALRPLIFPDGTERVTVYLGDLKAAPTARGGWALLQMYFAARSWVAGRTESAFGVVMDGTRVIPTHYTGKLGIPRARPAGQVWIFRVSITSPSHLPAPTCVFPQNDQSALNFFKLLSNGKFIPHGGLPEMRSEMKPTWIMDCTGQACARLEDTRLAKRLLDDAGDEIRTAHLAYLAAASPLAGTRLVSSALSLAISRGFPALFFSRPSVEGPDWKDRLNALGLQTEIATATVYAGGPLFDDAHTFPWHINTSEI